MVIQYNCRSVGAGLCSAHCYLNESRCPSQLGGVEPRPYGSPLFTNSSSMLYADKGNPVTEIFFRPRMTRMTRIAPLAHTIRILSLPGGHPRHLRHPRAKNEVRETRV